MSLPPSQAVVEERARVARPRLASRLSAALDAGSVLLTAPAGFGKTTALEEALRERGTPSAWISCTAAERGPGRLLIRLIDALRHAAPGAADVFGERLSLGVEQVDVGAAGAELAAELERLLVDPLVIVLDDAEALEGSPGSLSLAEALLRPSGGALHLALVSRRPLGLRTAKLRAAGRLMEFGPADLAFDVAECAEFLRLRGGQEPEPEAVEALMFATEGWPLGVAAGALDRAEPGLGLAEATAPARRLLRSHQQLYAFLAEEVLDRLDARTRDAVIDSSIPRQLDPGTVEALRLPADFLEEAERIGLFLRRVDSTSFSYHPLFREFLLERLAAERSRTRREQLHAQAAPAVAAAGHPIEAIEHWLEAGYWPQVIAGLDEQGPVLVRTSPDSVRAWLGRLPEEVRSDPAVRLLEGQLEWGAGDHERAAELLRGAIAGYRYNPDPPREWLARFTLADALFSLGAFNEAIRLSEGFDAPDAAAAGPLAPAVAMLAAACLAATGDLDGSDALATRARAFPAAAGLEPLESMRRAFVDTPAGRLDSAMAEMLRAHALMEHDDPFARLPYIQATIAMTCTEQGREAEALRWWHRVERGAGDGFTPYLQRMSRVHRGALHAQGGRLREAERELALAEPLQATGWRVNHLHVARATVAALRGDAAEAEAAAERALASVEPGPIVFRYLAAADLVPVLTRVGARARAHEVLEAALAEAEEILAGDRGSFMRARLHALRAWLAHAEGDVASLEAGMGRFWDEAGPNVHHHLRREWTRLEPVLWRALEEGVLDPAPVVRAMSHAFPEGAALLSFTDHPVAAVRRAVIAPVATSGHPDAAARLRRLTADDYPEVAASAQAAERSLTLTAPPLVFSLLGRFALRRGAWLMDDAAWGRPMAARLVRFLLMHRGSPVPEDLLFEAFWPDRTAAAARRNLQVAVSRARTVLDPPHAETSLIEVVDRAYRLELREEDLVDADEFEAVVESALRETGAGRRPLLERAKSLWGGEPLPEDRYAEWSVAWRARLVDRYIEVLSGLVDACTVAGDHPAAIEVSRELVDLDPLNESAHRDLMAAYARAGRTGHALRQFLECRRTLVDELGVEPAEPTSRLQARILAGEPV